MRLAVSLSSFSLNDISIVPLVVNVPAAVCHLVLLVLLDFLVSITSSAISDLLDPLSASARTVTYCFFRFLVLLVLIPTGILTNRIGTRSSSVDLFSRFLDWPTVLYKLCIVKFSIVKLSYSAALCNLLNWPVVHSCLEDDESVELSLLLLVLDCTEGVTDSESDSEMSNSLNACNSSDVASRLRFGIRAFSALFTSESTIA